MVDGRSSQWIASTQSIPSRKRQTSRVAAGDRRSPRPPAPGSRSCALVELELDAVERVARPGVPSSSSSSRFSSPAAARRSGRSSSLRTSHQACVREMNPGDASAHAVVDPREHLRRLVVVDETRRARLAGQLGAERRVTAGRPDHRVLRRRGRSRSARRSSPPRPRAPRSARRARGRRASCARIIRARMPRRRCVGRTPTTVTPAHGTGPPGTVSSNGNAPAPPTIAPPSKAACIRSSGSSAREPLGVLARSAPAEVVADRAERRRRTRPRSRVRSDRELPSAIFSSGAYSSISLRSLRPSRSAP